MIRAVAALFLLLAGILPAAGQASPKVQTRLIAEQDSVAPGGTLAVALEEKIVPGWHTYWRNPGDAGLPTTLQWTLPKGWTSGAIEWPCPKLLPVGPLMNYGYEGTVRLLTSLHVPKEEKPGAVILHVAASWLVCKQVCIPEEAKLSLPVSITRNPPPPYPDVAAQFAATRKLLPQPAAWPARFAFRNGLTLFLGTPPDVVAGVTDATFFPFDDGAIKGIAPQSQTRAAHGILLTLVPAKAAHAARRLNGVVELHYADGTTRAWNVSAVAGPVPAAPPFSGDVLTLPIALVFAFLGGLILNLMPCVLPVLAIKAVALASHAGKAAHHATREGFAYAAGAILSFAVLGGIIVALRAGGEAIGWGFQLQDPTVVALFALLMFAVALNLSGVFEIPGIGAGEGLTHRGGSASAFFTGALAVAVAAPCTAPFMATALGFALTQTSVVAIAVFLALGAGFAFPFTALSLWPGLRRVLPKPGPWLDRFRQFLAFPMYATALWLLWVLSIQAGPQRVVTLLIAVLLLAFGLWAFGASQGTSGWRRAVGIAALVLTLFAIGALVPSRGAGTPQAAMPSLADLPAESYTPARLAALRAANRPVFVNATAAWCVTCVVNERVALNDGRVRDAFVRGRVAYLLADWTSRNRDVTDLLAQEGRDGVPLYLYYAPGASEPSVLPQLLTPDAVLAALRPGSADAPVRP